MSWENALLSALLTILGGFIAGLTGLLVEWWRERRELRRRHLMDIKERCLKPLLEELHDLRRSFEVRESARLNSLEVRRSLESDVGRWWELFSFRRRVDSLLYEDLRDHFPRLYEELEGLESWVRAKYPEYLQAILRLLELIEGDSEFKAFEERFRKGFVNEVSSYPHDAIVFLALGLDKSYWPNVYSYIRPALGEVTRLGAKFYESAEARDARGLMGEAMAKVDECIRGVREATLKAKLKGRCRYLR
jgi:hypothetical protein